MVEEIEKDPVTIYAIVIAALDPIILQDIVFTRLRLDDSFI